MARGRRQRSVLHELFLLYVLGMALGGVFANLSFSFRNAAADAMSLFAWGKIWQVPAISRSYFRYLLFRRVRETIFFSVAGYTTAAAYLIPACDIFLGFLAGSLLSMAFLQNGFTGFFLFLAACFPHMLIYLAAYMFLFGNARTKKNQKDYLMACLMTLALCIFGVIIETFVNPLVLRLIVSMGEN